MHRSGPNTDYVDHLRQEYWEHEGAQKGITEFLGATGLNWVTMDEIDPEFLTISNRPKMNDPDKESPAIVIEPEHFKDTLNRFNGQIELGASLWSKQSAEVPDLPRRAILVWDVDVFNKNDPKDKFEDPNKTFTTIEPIYQLMKKGLKEYDLPFMAVASGGGWNFFTQVPYDSQVMEKLLGIAEVEPTVLGKQAHPNPSLRRTKPVPVSAEKGHLAATRLQQFLLNQIINQARKETGITVDISDKGAAGIAFDNTAMVYSVENRSFGVPGSPYFIKPEMIDPHFDKTFIRVPRIGNDYELELGELLDKRNHYERTSSLLDQIDCSIPDGSRGVENLLNDYLASDLRKLHEAMDESFGDPPEDFGKKYRQYGSIATKTMHPEKIRAMIDNAPEHLLKPEELDYFIWQIYNSWTDSPEEFEKAPHVAGLLRAIYEDPNLNWGNKWTKQTDAARYARGWTTLVLGQVMEKPAR